MKFRNRFIAIFLIATFIFSASMVTSSAASKEKYFGKTPNGQKIYYTVSKVKAHTIRKYAPKASKKDWDKYMKGAVDIALTVYKTKMSIPYGIVNTALGLLPKSNTYIRYGTRFFVDAQLHSIKQRTFYIYTNKAKTNKRVVYVDQYGTGDLLYYIDPVGKNVKIALLEKRSKRNVKLKTRCFDSTSYIKKRCGVNYNHKSKEVWKLDSEIVFQTFK